jgi:hypothetical protein
MNEITQNSIVKNVLVSNVEETFKSGCRFIGLTYTNENGETSRYNLLMGIRLESLYKSDKRAVEAMIPKLEGIKLVAARKILNSINNSLTKGIGNNDAYTLKSYYSPITKNGEVKLHVNEDGETFLYVRGYVINKTVIAKGVYPHVNSSAKTLAKKEIEKSLKRGKLRTFKINVNVLHSISTDGMKVEIS